jgi:hypothetical protein
VKNNSALARRWKTELGTLSGVGIDELSARAGERHSGKPHANLMMVDAY